MAVVRDPRASEILPPLTRRRPPIHLGQIRDRTGVERITYDHRHFFAGASRASFEEEYDRAWFSGALLSLGDALAQNNYFDRAPELEMIRHLRNAVGHGNRFRIDDPAKLAKFPADTRNADPQPGAARQGYLEITPAVHGQRCLFTFVDACELLVLFDAVGRYLL